MAVLAIKLSEHGRNCLGVILLLMNLSIAMMGLIMIVVGSVLAFIFGQQKDMLKDFNYRQHTYLIIFAGVGLIIFHLIGSKACLDYSNFKTRHRFKKFMLIYMGLLLVAFVLLMAVSISATTAIYSLHQRFEKGFLDLMGSYEADTDKRSQIDRMQITHRCCGSTGYKDWTETSWYPEEFIRPELQSLKSRGVPFTCCDPTYMGPCLHDAGGQHQRPGYQKDNGKSFYPNGCSEAVTLTLRWLLKNLALWLMLPMWLELVTLILTKYLYTSCKNAVENGEESGKGFGYLMQTCPCTCCEFLECDIDSMQRKKPGKPG